MQQKILISHAVSPLLSSTLSQGISTLQAEGRGGGFFETKKFKEMYEA